MGNVCRVYFARILPVLIDCCSVVKAVYMPP